MANEILRLYKTRGTNMREDHIVQSTVNAGASPSGSAYFDVVVSAGVTRMDIQDTLQMFMDYYAKNDNLVHKYPTA